MNELKPCPFCGGKAEFKQTGYGTTDKASVRLSFSVRCKKCYSTCPDSSGYIAITIYDSGELNLWHDDRNKAAEAWNRRAE